MRWQWGLAAAVLIGSIVVPALAADDNPAAPGGVFSKMIGGKEWRVEPIAGTNNFKVTWGDKTVTWSPKPWQPRELQQQGPSYYWKIFGEKTPYYPMDKTMDERAKLDGQDVERGWVLVEDTSQMLDWKGGFCFDIISAGGEVRTRCGIEWKRAYLRPEYKAVRNSTTPPLLNKRFIVLTAPRSVRGIGFLTFVYDDPVKEQDGWLYLPSVRKVRRLATASKQDYFAGTPLRNEDLPQTSPYNHNYKVLRLELMDDPGPKQWGFGDSGWEKKEERLDGIGCPHWVVEVTPKESDYWFAKKIQWVNMFTFGVDQEFAYDKNGEVIRVGWYNHRPATLIDPNVPPSYLIFSTDSFFDTRTGYKSVFWGAHRRKNVPWEESFFDTKFSEDLFNPDLLTNEYTSTTQYGPTPANWVLSEDPWPQDPAVVTKP
ncbi:MAG: outer membrane lipoprotein-sorting protein [Candidatus Binatus sp.]|uniref:outer membrane lipoprotein-sorting protein n=1 Tax=Candidatus Binatus sp. TaxID=2811406 RepID=UPI003BAEFFD7